MHSMHEVVPSAVSAAVMMLASTWRTILHPSLFFIVYLLSFLISRWLFFCPAEIKEIAEILGAHDILNDILRRSHFLYFFYFCGTINNHFLARGLEWRWWGSILSSLTFGLVCSRSGELKRAWLSSRLLAAFLFPLSTFLFPLHDSHARCRSQRRQRCRQYRYDNLNNCLPTFLFHSITFSIVIG